MKSEIRKALALLGGAAVITLAVSYGAGAGAASTPSVPLDPPGVPSTDNSTPGPIPGGPSNQPAGGGGVDDSTTGGGGAGGAGG